MQCLGHRFGVLAQDAEVHVVAQRDQHAVRVRRHPAGHGEPVPGGFEQAADLFGGVEDRLAAFGGQGGFHQVRSDHGPHVVRALYAAHAVASLWWCAAVRRRHYRGKRTQTGDERLVGAGRYPHAP